MKKYLLLLALTGCIVGPNEEKNVVPPTLEEKTVVEKKIIKTMGECRQEVTTDCLTTKGCIKLCEYISEDINDYVCFSYKVVDCN